MEKEGETGMIHTNAAAEESFQRFFYSTIFGTLNSFIPSVLVSHKGGNFLN